MKMFSVYDRKANFYLTPFSSKNGNTATREFSVAVQEEGSMFNRHPEDFVLVEVGDFDEVTGLLVGNDQPVPVCTAEALMSVKGE